MCCCLHHCTHGCFSVLQVRDGHFLLPACHAPLDGPPARAACFDPDAVRALVRCVTLQQIDHASKICALRSMLDVAVTSSDGREALYDAGAIPVITRLLLVSSDDALVDTKWYAAEVLSYLALQQTARDSVLYALLQSMPWLERKLCRRDPESVIRSLVRKLCSEDDDMVQLVAWLLWLLSLRPQWRQMMVKAPTFAAVQRILCGCHSGGEENQAAASGDGPRCVCCPLLERSLSGSSSKRRTLLRTLSFKLRSLPASPRTQAGVDCRASVADTDDALWPSSSSTNDEGCLSGACVGARPDESMGSLAAACRLLRSLSMAEEATCFVAGGATSGALLNIIARCGRGGSEGDGLMPPGIIARTAAATALCNLLLLRLQHSKALQLHNTQPLLEHLATLLQHQDGLIQRSAVRLIKVHIVAQYQLLSTIINNTQAMHMHTAWVAPLQTSSALTSLVALCRPDNTLSLEEVATTLARYVAAFFVAAVTLYSTLVPTASVPEHQRPTPKSIWHPSASSTTLWRC